MELLTGLSGYWQQFLAEQCAQPYFKQLLTQLENETAAGQVIYPQPEHWFNALKVTPMEQVKVVILGQDPYHGAKQAHGLAFSVQSGIKPPPSLRNIFIELQQEYPNFTLPPHGDLTAWAKQGVLLLNTVLTVRAGEANSHAKIGWQQFTDNVLQAINERCANVVFLLWGKPAQAKANMIDENKHTILTSVHPSPLSAHRGFFGCDHFKQTNQRLQHHKLKPIDWQL